MTIGGNMALEITMALVGSIGLLYHVFLTTISPLPPLLLFPSPLPAIYLIIIGAPAHLPMQPDSGWASGCLLPVLT